LTALSNQVLDACSSIILSEAKDLTLEVWIMQIQTCDQPGLCEVPHRLRGSG